MSLSRHASFLVGLLVLTQAPGVLHAQSGSIMATATVRARPLSLLDVTRSAVPGELYVRVEGCGEGAVSVDARTAATTVRTSRVLLRASDGCATRTVTVVLAGDLPAVRDFVVSLEQSDGLLSPAFAQFVVPIAVARAATGGVSVAH